MTATAGVIGPSWESNAAGTTMTSVFVAIGGAFGPGFVVAADGLATAAGLLLPRFAPDFGTGLAAGFAAAGFAAAGFSAPFAAAGFAAPPLALGAGFAAALAAGLAATFAALGAALAGAAGRVAVGALDRAVLRFGAAVDRRRVVPDPEPVDPVDVSSAIAFSSGVPRALSLSADVLVRERLLTAR